jgi:hypothetical protein
MSHLGALDLRGCYCFIVSHPKAQHCFYVFSMQLTPQPLRPKPAAFDYPDYLHELNAK